MGTTASAAKNVYLLKVTLSDKTVVEIIRNVTKNYKIKFGSSTTETSIALTKLDFVKKIYYPCEINAELSLSFKAGVPVPSLSDVRAVFANAASSMDVVAIQELFGTIISQTTVGAVASGYSVVDTDVLYNTNGTSTDSLYVRLKMCSPDYHLGTLKYSKAHTGKKFGTIVGDTMTSFLGSSSALSINLRFLSYSRYNGASTVTDELIQPYLVQYNETFYDFARRVANRCGEYLYFEDGKLNLGLAKHEQTGIDGKVAETVTAVSSYLSVVFHDFSRASVADINYCHHNPLKSSENVLGGKNGGYNLENASDEYLDAIPNSGYDTKEKEYDANYPNWGSEIVGAFFNAPNLMQGAVDLGVSQGKAWRFSQMTSDDQEKKYKTEYFNDSAWYPEKKDGTVEDPRAFYGYYNRIKDKSGSTSTEFAQFSTHSAQNASTTKRNVNSGLYTLVCKAQQKLEDTAVEIDLGANLQCLGLGHIISIDGNGDSKYIVVEVSGKDVTDGSSGWKESMTIKAVPYDSSEPVPPAVPGGHVLHSGPQTAKIAKDGLDPRRMGRVRILYWWQASTDEPSPWIRVATLNATTGGGTYFKPEVGDECLIGYECGNIERPYVAGYLNNENRKTRYGTREYSDIVSNGGGQTIRIKDIKDDTMFWAGVFPIFGAIKSFFPGVCSDKSKFRKVSGSTEFTDEYGLYSFKMSSADRKISIASPFGDVVSNAMTGINLQAPNGDIKIVGKNVTIKAGNNLTLTSGANIVDKKQITSSSTFGSVVGTTVNSLVEKLENELLDLSLLRCLVETFIKPIAGNTTLKSNRFLLLEAGEGKTSLPKEVYDTAKKREWALTEDVGYQTAKVLHDLPLLIDALNNFFVERHTKATNLRDKLTTYHNSYDNFFTEQSKWRSTNVLNNPEEKVGTQNMATFLQNHQENGIILGNLPAQLSEVNINTMVLGAVEIKIGVKELKKPDEFIAPVNAFLFPDKAKTAINSVINGGWGSKKFDNTQGFQEYIDSIRPVAPAENKRRLLWAFLQQFTASHSGGLLQIELPANPSFTSQGWRETLDKIKSIDDTQKSGIGSNFVAKLKDVASFVLGPAKDFFSWSSDTQGSIIMSQKNGKLIKFDNLGHYLSEPSSSLVRIVEVCKEIGR